MQKNEDCRFYYTSHCSKGSKCLFRHEPAAKGCTTVCTYWKKGRCTNIKCKFRHSNVQKDRSVIPCYWESKPEGCTKDDCPFQHEAVAKVTVNTTKEDNVAINVPDTTVKQLQNISINSSDINILLLGETGVGKSTFVNSFANYLTFKTMDQALTGSIMNLIPTTYAVMDANNQVRQLRIGSERNETTTIVDSATQTSRGYVFRIPGRDCRVRIIDTPGLCDPRGTCQDYKNLENVLSYISNVEYLHAICFLMRPNCVRLTVMYKYCIKQLLSRLEKSASKNIVFLFTNTRSSFYEPGDTAYALSKVLKEIEEKPPNVHIDFTLSRNVFCFDNEGFKYVVACQNGIPVNYHDCYGESWKKSAMECDRLISYLIGGESRIIPHRVKYTISVNEARRVVVQLTRPLADITEYIDDNTNILKRHKAVLLRDDDSIDSLKAKLYVPVVNLQHTALPKPTTVCANKNCCEIYIVEGRKKYHYKQRCHDPCYLKSVPRELVGSPELRHCATMKSNNRCEKCQCDFSSHMHIYYTTETVQENVAVESVRKQINDKESGQVETAKVIQIIKKKVQGYKQEKEFIVKTMAKFAHFLQSNAIAPFNDSYKAYIQYFVEREKSYGPDCNPQIIAEYNKLLQQYEQEKLILRAAMTQDVESVGQMTSQTIFGTIKELFVLPYSGHIIKELYEVESQGHNNEYSHVEVVL